VNIDTLETIVQQRLDYPSVLGRLACQLQRGDLVAQQHHDGKLLDIVWRNRGDHWRCTIFLDKATDLALAQVDIHTDGTIRVEAWEPCSVTVSPGEDSLVLTRYRSK
jgi:hypothetical protein